MKALVVEALQRGLVACGVAAAAAAVLMVGHATDSRAHATENGGATGDFTVTINGEELECLIRVTMTGGRPPVTEEHGDYLDSSFVADGQCPIGDIDDPAAERYPVDDLVQSIEGSYNGSISENDPNGNGVLDGFATGRFNIQLVAETTGQGTLRTEEQQPIVIDCENMDLRTRPATYDCTLSEPVELFGSEATVMLVALNLTFEEEGYVPKDMEGPKAGHPPIGTGASLANSLIAALAAAGALLFVSGALITVRGRAR
jgi:hypothetical protein